MVFDTVENWTCFPSHIGQSLPTHLTMHECSLGGGMGRRQVDALTRESAKVGNRAGQGQKIVLSER